jgi:hypothetical protein
MSKLTESIKDLPNTPHYDKTAAIQQWIGRVLGKIEHYKSEHYVLLKDSMTQLELALWKSKLHEMEGEEFSLLFEFWSLCVSLEKKMTLLESARWKAKVLMKSLRVLDMRHVSPAAQTLLSLMCSLSLSLMMKMYSLYFIMI